MVADGMPQSGRLTLLFMASATCLSPFHVRCNGTTAASLANPYNGSSSVFFPKSNELLRALYALCFEQLLKRPLVSHLSIQPFPWICHTATVSNNSTQLDH
ncbi:hypothetical protein J3E69DRAFT_322110 [Trichoderma sp. SZMC 28015]